MFSDDNIKDLIKIAKKGDVDAQYRLGYCYEKGIGVKINPDRAVKWYKKAVKQGYAEAQYRLGFYYYSTNSYAHRRPAVDLYERAAQQGHAKAQYELAKDYERMYRHEPIFEIYRNLAIECIKELLRKVMSKLKML